MNAGCAARAWRLGPLLDGFAAVPDGADAAVADLSLDSRQVSAGTLFLAVPGSRHDGRDFIDEALAAGAVAVVYEAVGCRRAERRAIPVNGLRPRVGLIADRFFDAPSARLNVVGVTGTNGKTSCAMLGARALTALGHRCGVIGTLGSGFPDALDAGALTTPDAVGAHRRLAALAAAGADFVCMEVSSHALDQDRVAGVRFRGAVFTNLTRDHIDYHGDMAAYGAAKARLFEGPLDWAAVNCDDPFGAGLAARLSMDVLTFGERGGRVRLRRTVVRPRGIDIDIDVDGTVLHVRSRLMGRFNARNLLAVTAVLVAFGHPPATFAPVLEALPPVAGRMEVVDGPPGPAPVVVVDYAHTPDALEQALAGLREHAAGRLWCVFGCGGDRDPGKRPLMGAIGERLADQVVVTDDNPRSEDPAAIVAAIVAGMTRPPRVVHDRARAIALAVGAAAAGDVVLIAGKGHEDYQIRGSERIPFSDVAVARAALEARG